MSLGIDEVEYVASIMIDFRLVFSVLLTAADLQSSSSSTCPTPGALYSTAHHIQLFCSTCAHRCTPLTGNLPITWCTLTRRAGYGSQ